MKTEKAFLHVPKTGGTSKHGSGFIHNLGHVAVVDEVGVGNPIYAHKDHQRSYYQNSVVRAEQIQHMLVLATVRNPFAWLISWFDFMGGFEPWDGTRDLPETRLAQRGFEEFVTTICTRTDYWPNKKFLFFQLFSIPNGTLVADHILHTENLDVEFDEITGHRGKHTKAQIGKRRTRGFTTNAEFYSRFPGLADRVADTYRREFWLYGYSFDPSIEVHDPENALLTGNVLDKQGHIWYDWETDTLGVGRMTFGANS